MIFLNLSCPAESQILVRGESDLKFNSFPFEFECADFEVDANGWQEAIVEHIIRESEQEA